MKNTREKLFHGAKLIWQGWSKTEELTLTVRWNNETQYWELRNGKGHCVFTACSEGAMHRFMSRHGYSILTHNKSTVLEDTLFLLERFCEKGHRWELISDEDAGVMALFPCLPGSYISYLKYMATFGEVMRVISKIALVYKIEWDRNGMYLKVPEKQRLAVNITQWGEQEFLIIISERPSKIYGRK